MVEWTRLGIVGEKARPHVSETVSYRRRWCELHALIEEMPDGDWRAVGIVRLNNKSEVQQQPVGIGARSDCLSLWAAARDYLFLGRADAVHGFRSALMFAALMIGHHFSISALCCAASASGVCLSRGQIS
jgi:hypothetical protein